MKKYIPFILFLVFFFFLSCGKKGPIHPPLLKLPQKVESFSITQQGKSLVLEWKNPQTYTDGSPLTELSQIEVWMLREEEKKEKGKKEKKQEEKKDSTLQKQFEEKAQLVRIIKKDEFSQYRVDKGTNSFLFRYVYPLEKEDFLSYKYTFALRVRDKRNKKSSFCELKSVEPLLVSLPPPEVKAQVTEEGIELEWEIPQKNIDQSFPPNIQGFNVYRAEEEEEYQRLNSQIIRGNRYVDKDFSWEKIYYYLIRTSATDSPPYVESENSEVKEIKPEDKFPPDAPQNLEFITGKNTVALSWTSNQELDLEGYRVWRKKEGEEEYELLTTKLIKGNTYSDSTVEKNKIYYYAITALDKAGNESSKSKPVLVKIEE